MSAFNKKTVVPEDFLKTDRPPGRQTTEDRQTDTPADRQTEVYVKVPPLIKK